jgi:CMP/dCMP kinase
MQLSEKMYNQDNNLVVALDGPSAAGKGLIGSMLAQEFGLIYVQSSIVYRGLAYICLQDNVSPICLQDNVSPDDIDSVIKLSATADVISQLRGVDLNLEIIGDVASKISIITQVREHLGHYLQNLIKTTPRVIMEGRDIGTVIAPDADLKIFLTANVQVRATRRFKQLRLEGKECKLSDVLDLLKSRDKRDRVRNAAPLKAAADAFVIDVSDLTPAEVIQKIKDFVG